MGKGRVGFELDVLSTSVKCESQLSARSAESLSESMLRYPYGGTNLNSSFSTSEVSWSPKVKYGTT